jgi:hypothetical protein
MMRKRTSVEAPMDADYCASGLIRGGNFVRRIAKIHGRIRFIVRVSANL